MTTPRCRQTTGISIGVALGVIGLAGVVLPSLLGLSVMGGGYARLPRSPRPHAGLVAAWVYWPLRRPLP